MFISKKDKFKIYMFIKNSEKVRNKIPKDKLSEFDSYLEVVKKEYEKIKRG